MSKRSLAAAAVLLLLAGAGIGFYASTLQFGAEAAQIPVTEVFEKSVSVYLNASWNYTDTSWTLLQDLNLTYETDENVTCMLVFSANYYQGGLPNFEFGLCPSVNGTRLENQTAYVSDSCHLTAMYLCRIDSGKTIIEFWWKMMRYTSMPPEITLGGGYQVTSGVNLLLTIIS